MPPPPKAHSIYLGIVLMCGELTILQIEFLPWDHCHLCIFPRPPWRPLCVVAFLSLQWTLFFHSCCSPRGLRPLQFPQTHQSVAKDHVVTGTHRKLSRGHFMARPDGWRNGEQHWSFQTPQIVRARGNPFFDLLDGRQALQLPTRLSPKKWLVTSCSIPFSSCAWSPQNSYCDVKSLVAFGGEWWQSHVAGLMLIIT